MSRNTNKRIQVAMLAIMAMLAQTTQGQATAYTWTNGNNTNDLTTATNWTPNAIPTTTDTVTFGTAAISKPPLTPYLSLGSVQHYFDVNTISFPDATPYTITITDGLPFAIEGGVSNTGGAAQNFQVLNSAGLFIKNGASADATNSGNMHYNTAGGGYLAFYNAAQGSNANVNLSGGGGLYFNSSLIAGNTNTLGALSSASSNDLIDLNGCALTIGANNTDTTIAGSIINGVGSGSLTKVGSGTTTLLGNNSFTSGLFVNSGNVVGNATSLNSYIALAQNTTLTFNQTTAGTFNGLIYNLGNVVKTGTAPLTLTPIAGQEGNVYTGTTVVQDNSVLQAGAVDIFSGYSDFILGDGVSTTGTLSLSPSPGVSYNNAIGSLSDYSTTPGAVFLGNSTLTLNYNFDNNQNTTFYGAINSSVGTAGGITIEGGGTLTLAGHNNNYTGSTQVNNGTLRAGDMYVFAPNSNVTLGNGNGSNPKIGILDLNNYDNAIGSLADNSLTPGYVLLGSGILTLNSNTNTGYAGTMYGVGGLTLAGTGTMTFSGSNQIIYTGDTQVLAGTLQAGAANVFAPQSNVFLGSGEAGGTTGTLNLFDASTGLSYANTISSLQDDSVTPGVVNLGEAILTLGNSEDQTYYGTLTGGTGGIVKQGSGTFTLAGGNTNDYKGSTVVLDGVLQAGVANAFSPESAVFLGGSQQGILDLNDFPNTIASLSDTPAIPGIVSLGTGDAGDGILTVGNSSFTIFHGNIHGTGGLIKQGAGILELTGTSTYTGGTAIVDGILAGTTRSLQGDIENDSLLVFIQQDGGTYHDAMSGSGAVFVFSEDTIIFTGNNTYQGGTLLLSGTLQGDASSLQGLIEIGPNKLVFNQTHDGAFNGQLLGNGNIQKTGYTTLIFGEQTKANAYAGNTYINEGTLALNTLLGGNVTVSGGTLSGTGTVGGDLTVNIDSTIAPGNSIGTLHVAGNYTQNPESVYQVQIDSHGASSLIQVNGTATLNGGDVVVSALDNEFDLNTPYTILHADQGVTGAFEEVHAPNLKGNALFGPVIRYDTDNAFLTIQTALILAAETCNEMAAARQLDSIVNPNIDETAVLNTLINLPVDQVSHALAQIDGQQFTSQILLAEIGNRQFLRRLYDPVRTIISTIPNEDQRACCYLDGSLPPGLDFWFEGGSNRTFLHGDHNVSGFNTDGYELVGGFQSPLDENWTVGIAGGYAFDHVHYNIGGSSKNTSYFAGAYALYRPCGYYLLGDAIYGQSDNKLKRKIDFGTISRTAHSKPKVYLGTLYAEVGKDLDWQFLLVQPFVGLEFDYAYRNHIKEHGADSLDLIVHKKNVYSASSRLGLHITSQIQPYSTVVSLDLAWQYCFTSLQNHVHERFKDFGDSFKIHGPSGIRSSLDGTVNITTALNDTWSIYGELTGQRWQKVSTYTALGGVEAHW